MGRISLGKVKGDDGKNVFIKFNTSPSDAGASETWQNGMNYIGFALSAEAEAPSAGYRWAKFVGEAGAAGATGANGANGEKGDKGDDGRGIASITSAGTDSNGGNKYRITFTDGTTFDFTAPRGPEGPSVNTSGFVTKGAFDFNSSTATLKIII